MISPRLIVKNQCLGEIYSVLPFKADPVEWHLQGQYAWINFQCFYPEED